MRRLIWLLAGALLGLVVAPPPARTAPTTTLTLVADETLSADGRLHELTLLSGALGRETKVRVLLPATVGDGRRYPVLFLLHGVGDDQTKWTDNTDVEEATAGLDLIVVMPDAGRAPDSGWYSDWVDGPRWESYHIGELVPFVDAFYPTLGTRAGRATAGLSMGGFGAVSYAARHPDLFVSAAGFSGAVDNVAGGPVQAAAYELAHDRFGTPDDRVWGPYETDEVRWRDHNPPDLSPNLRGTVLSLATGNGVPAAGDDPVAGTIEAAVYLQNVRFHGDLVGEGIAHEWRDRGHGTHEWHYWQDDLHQLLPKLMATFAAPPAPPATFDYRRSAGVFSVWGWTFTAERAVMEFLDLVNVSPAGLTARGSGTVHVVTPPQYSPGAAYAVTGNGIATADAGGRLRFDVDLGPSHTAQQYTPEAAAAESLGGSTYWRMATVTIVPA